MEKRVRIAVLAMGFSGLVAQILLLREFLIVFSGNELSIGIILANWVILEAFGSFYFGRKFEKSQHKLETFAVITILFFVSLLAAIFLVRILKSVIGVSIGESIGFWPMFYSSFLLQLPASILHGALFTSSCQIYSLFSGQDPSSAGRVYADETVGTVIGAIVGTYLFIPHLNTFQASIWLALLNFIVCLALLLPYWKTRPFQNTILVVLSVLVFFSGYLVFAGHADKLHHYSIKAQWKNQNVVHYQNSPYGNICVIENEGQYIFFQDGIPTVITPVPDKIDYAELDPLLISLFRKFPTPLTESELSDGRVKITHIDGRLFLRSTQEKYDLILVGITEPSNLQANRFFTKEFFSLAKERLNESGILVLGLPGSLTYMNQELKNLNSSIFHTLRSVFPYIRVVPGDGTNLFLSSDYRGILEIDRMLVMERLIQRKIKADVMIPWYIEQKLHPGWQDWFSLFIQESSQKINSDFTPRGVFYSISHWNALFAPYLRWPFAQFERIDVRTIAPLFVIPLLLYVLFRFRKIRFFRAGIPLVIITTGFAGMIFDLMLIFAFQSIYGYVFSWIGILVASFMAGAAFGAMWITRVLERLKNSFKLFVKIDLAIICFSIVCPYIILGAYSYLGNPDAFFFSKALFLVLSFISGMLIGSLLGGWFGGIVGAVVLLPVLGLLGTGIVVALLKLTSFISITTYQNQLL
jgi:spermidine synthase